MKRPKNHLQDIKNYLKISNLRIIGVQELAEQGQGVLFKEIVIESFPKLEKGVNIQVQEGLRTPKIDSSQIRLPQGIC